MKLGRSDTKTTNQAVWGRAASIYKSAVVSREGLLLPNFEAVISWGDAGLSALGTVFLVGSGVFIHLS